MKRIVFAVIFLTLGSILFPSNSLAYQTGQSASVVIGQSRFTNNQANAPDVSKGYNYNYGMATDGTHLLVSDFNNNRVLIYNSIPIASGALPDVVVGQPDMNSSGSNQGGSVAANTLHNPAMLATDGTKLFIADAGNNRVLIYNHIPTTNNASADVVVGQPNMIDNQSNQGGSPDANTINNPTTARIYGTKLIITDSSNNRILIFNSIPISDNASADVVVGQQDMISNLAEGGGTVDANVFSNPGEAIYDGSSMIVSDFSNNRVLFFSGIPSSNNASAVKVFGQSNFTNNSQGNTATELWDNEGSIAFIGTSLFVGDSSNNRVLMYDNYTSLPSGSAASIAVGQTNLTNNEVDGDTGAIKANGISNPSQLVTDGRRLIITDSNNNRILIFNTIPTTNGASADVVIGQQNMSSGEANQGGTLAANTLANPQGMFTDGTHLFVTDCGNNRVLIYNHIPTTNNVSADVVIGQPNMNSNGVNPVETTLTCPQGVSYDTQSGKLIITDSNSNRVLIFNSLPTTDNAIADVVIGQQDLSSNGSNQGGSVAANTISFPYTAYMYGSRLVINDDGNARILIYNSIPITNNASADVVIGQPDMNSGDSHTVVNVFANTLSGSDDTAYDGTNFFVTDRFNHRILIYNGIPTTNNASAAKVIGQDDFTSTVQGTTDTLIKTPEYITALSGKFIVNDYENNRILIYYDQTTPPALSSAGSPSCNDFSPSSPDLFQIDATKNTATLYFTSAGYPSTYHFLSFGQKVNAEQFGAYLAIPYAPGVQSYTATYLLPNTTYFFKIRGGNGCMPGAWSRTLKVKTDSKYSAGSLIYYAYYSIVRKAGKLLHY